MAHRQIPRYEPPPPALSMANSNRASFLSVLSEQLSASAASAASASSQAAQQTQSTTAADASGTATNSQSKSQTVETIGIIVPASTPSPSNSVASQTDSNASTITSAATTASQSSTFSTSASNSAASDQASHHPSNSSDSSLQTANKGYHSGPSGGKIAAAIAIPLIFLLALGFGLFYLRRRRRRRSAALAGSQPYHHHPMTDRSRSAFSKEAALAKSTPPAIRNPNPNASAAPILTSATNNSYYTGLSTPTTPSRASTQTRGRSNDSARPESAALPASIYEIPPPAYAKHAPPGSTPTLPQLSFATDPFMDPVSPITSTSDHSSPTNAALAALSGRDTAFTATSLSPVSNSRSGNGVTRPNISRAGTMRSVASVTSDMYSDTASVHSARPARMSGVAAQVVGSGSRLSGGSYAPGWVVGGDGRGDPFGDPGR
jgi:hypothetical protein